MDRTHFLEILVTCAQRAQRAREDVAELVLHAHAAIDSDHCAAWHERIDAWGRSATVAAETAALKTDVALENYNDAAELEHREHEEHQT